MKKMEILEILKSWNFWDQDLPTGFFRDSYLSRMDSLLGSGQVLMITGARRSGKSYLMRQYLKRLMERGMDKHSILMINLEDPRFEKMDARGLERVYQVYVETLSPKEKPYVFLDEIQEVGKWEKWVRMMHELDKAYIIVSGSNSKLLDSELATTLTGRHLDLSVFPLSFGEFLKFRDIEAETEEKRVWNQTKIMGALAEYMEFGGFPEVVLNQEKQALLLRYFQDILDRDLIKRYRIRKREELKKMVKFYFSNVSALMSFNSLSKELSTTTNTVEKFSSYLESVYLSFLLKRFSFKVKEQEKSPRKIYSVDTGLANAVGFRFIQNRGKLIENLVFLELMRKKTDQIDMEVYYWKDAQHREVDFVVKVGTKVRELIQVCWNISAYKTKEREVKSLLKGMNALKMKKGLIITEEYEAEEKVDNKTIAFQPLWKWLLER